MRQFTLPFLIVSLLAATGCSSQPVHRDTSIALTTVASVDLERYQGRWYEIARLPNSFEKNCVGVTADYAKREDGLISVTNSCRKHTLDGAVRVAKGKARVVDATTNAKLQVSFFGPFWGDYWIIGLADDYSLALVGEPSGKYLWILSRTPQISEESLSDAKTTLLAFGYDLEALEFPLQASGQ